MSKMARRPGGRTDYVTIDIPISFSFIVLPWPSANGREHIYFIDFETIIVGALIVRWMSNLCQVS